jgi:cobalt-zinc-cadmium efflux system outer membrane protein
MHFSSARPRIAATIGLSALAFSVGAQTARPTLREAVDAAWRLSPQARALASRHAELDARARAAGSFLAGAPSVSLAHKAGRGAASRAQETEAEISAPIWQPKLRSATVSQVEADRAALDGQIVATKLKLAAEARELAAVAALAEAQIELASRKVAETQALATDTERRVRAGESARVDSLRAQSALSEAQSARAAADGALARVSAAWRALTGLSQPARLDEPPGAEGVHPLVQAAEAQARAARSKLEVTEADRRDPMEVGVGLVRERPGGGAPTESAVRLSLRVPLGGDIRNGARIAAARAELDAAEAELDASRRMATTEREAAIAQLEAARRSERLAVDRERFAREAQELIAKSHRLGETDLPTRLRADAERFEAELARARASIEARRALSKFNQANGAMP